MLMSLTSTVEMHDSKIKEEEYVEEANWEQEIEEQEYKKQDIPTSSIKIEDTIVMQNVSQAKLKSNQNFRC